MSRRVARWWQVGAAVARAPKRKGRRGFPPKIASGKVLLAAVYTLAYKPLLGSNPNSSCGQHLNTQRAVAPGSE